MFGSSHNARIWISSDSPVAVPNRIYIDGKDCGKFFPADFYKVQSGKHSVIVENGDGSKKEFEVAVNSDHILEVKLLMSGEIVTGVTTNEVSRTNKKYVLYWSWGTKV